SPKPYPLDKGPLARNRVVLLDPVTTIVSNREDKRTPHVGCVCRCISRPPTLLRNYQRSGFGFLRSGVWGNRSSTVVLVNTTRRPVWPCRQAISSPARHRPGGWSAHPGRWHFYPIAGQGSVGEPSHGFKHLTSMAKHGLRGLFGGPGRQLGGGYAGPATRIPPGEMRPRAAVLSRACLSERRRGRFS